MIRRELTDKIVNLRGKFPVITLTGPRQTGKTTLLKSVFSDKPYVSLEDLDNRSLAQNDPRGFLSNFPDGAVIDEIQNVPDLFSYLQGIVDSKDIEFAISGSQNFSLIESITQTLAGRTASLKLLPFSYSELSDSHPNESIESQVFKGGYPRIYDKNIDPLDFYPNYVATYVERDVRQIKSIEDLHSFSTFLKLCAGRVGQLLNYQTLANDAGISPNTAKSWLSVLEASYIIYFLQPHHKNFNKRLVKSPKLYFYDTGLASSLLNIQNENQYTTHYLRGGLFENFVLNEFLKFQANKGIKNSCYFWQSKDKKEVDILLEHHSKTIPYEVKSAKTRNENMLSNLKYWKKLNPEIDNEILNVIYAGDENFKTSQGNFLSWKNINQKLNELYSNSN